MVKQMNKVAASPAVAVVGAGAVLANPGAFIPLALKEISETNPSSTEYVVDWVFFSVVSLLPLLLALVMLVVARDRTRRCSSACATGCSPTCGRWRPSSSSCSRWRLIRNGIAGLVG